ncbi:programmed cell death 1 ligand 1-like isoform X3 [Falco rusticolus]|uniref:programmed cell death 1 ligand 1-like isoform X3 n=2 Tax=Falco TaxID=8952 RepID=UPI001886740B|nr:programmed cell death 1 ligand 1-like isoform X3 [Falco rusticolus]
MISTVRSGVTKPGSIYIMEKPLLLFIFIFYWHFLNALFTVEAPQSLYTVEHGNNVTMECTFPVNGKLKFGDLSVSWEKKDELKQVYALLKGEEDFKSQHSDFRGRIKLLKENLNLGRSLLHITDVKLRDAGFYRCVIGYGGADYKIINLKVKAPYRTITQGVVSTRDNEWKLTCQSEGYPQAEVMWRNRRYEDLTDKANTSYETGSDQLYRVTSTLTIKSRIDEFFYCIFWNKELQENTSAILHIAARANKDTGTPVASSSIAKLSKEKDTHDCRDASFEDELKSGVYLVTAHYSSDLGIMQLFRYLRRTALDLDCFVVHLANRRKRTFSRLEHEIHAHVIT